MVTPAPWRFTAVTPEVTGEGVTISIAKLVGHRVDGISGQQQFLSPLQSSTDAPCARTNAEACGESAAECAVGEADSPGDGRRRYAQLQIGGQRSAGAIERVIIAAWSRSGSAMQIGAESQERDQFLCQSGCWGVTEAVDAALPAKSAISLLDVRSWLVICMPG